MRKSLLARWSAGLAVTASALVAVPAAATPAGDNVVINEVYVNGGSAGATYLNKFIELYNPTEAPIDVNGWSVQYRSATATGNFTGIIPLGNHHIEPGGTFLVGGNSNAANGAALPATDASSTSFSIGGASAGGTLALSKSATPLSGAVSTVFADTNYVDLIGYGTSVSFEGAVKASGYSVTASLNRSGGADTDDNSADFQSAGPTPVACGTLCDNGSDPGSGDPVEATIAEIQGDGAASDFNGKDVITEGVVTAVYKTGGYNGAFIQTEGTGGDIDLDSHTASDGIYVFGSQFTAAVDKGDFVKVTATVEEFNGLTELTFPTWEILADAPDPVTPAEVEFPLSETQRESLEGMLVLPQGDYTITDNYATNTFAEIGIVDGSEPLQTPTNVVRPGTPEYASLVTSNAQRLVTLDDGASANYFTSSKDVAMPWLTLGNEVRVGSPVTFDDPVVLDYRNNAWKLQPTEHLVAGGDEPVTFGSTRAAGPEDVGGDLKIATFNVLNYFTTLGEDYVSSGDGLCTFYPDRAGTNVTTRDCGNPSTTSGNGPRGAANQASFERQQAKIVKAINALDADVVSLEEIESSDKFGKPRDEALDTLVAALNAEAGEGTWAAVASPANVPVNGGTDVIRTAFIYKPAAVEEVGDSVILDSPLFANARAPLSQVFKPAGGAADSEFLVIVNHFKSKSSGTGENADQGDGQGASNPARVAQAHALVDFAADREAAVGTDRVFLTGDFNAYSEEDPIEVIEDAGFINVPRELTDKDTYQFGGAVGSLDHVFASATAFDQVSGADIWNVNAYESVAREYSRHNYNAAPLYDPASPFRASDHDPAIIGYDVSSTKVETTTTVDTDTRIDAGDDAVLDVTVEGLASSPPTGTVSVSEGDGAPAESALEAGKASVTISDLSLGTHVLDVAYSGDADYSPSSATVTIKVVKGKSALAATIAPSAYGKSAVVKVTGAPGAGGLVYIGRGDTVLGSGMLSNGAVNIALGKTALKPGTYSLDVYYLGNGQFEPTNVAVSLAVAKGATKVSKSSVTKKIKAKKTKATLKVKVSATGFAPTGKVKVYYGSKVYGSANVKGGVAKIKLKKFTSKGTKKLTVKYAGSSYAKPSRATIKVKIVK